MSRQVGTRALRAALGCCSAAWLDAPMHSTGLLRSAAGQLAPGSACASQAACSSGMIPLAALHGVAAMHTESARNAPVRLHSARAGTHSWPGSCAASYATFSPASAAPSAAPQPAAPQQHGGDGAPAAAPLATALPHEAAPSSSASAVPASEAAAEPAPVPSPSGQHHHAGPAEEAAVAGGSPEPAPNASADAASPAASSGVAPASRKDSSAPADTVYPSSSDDNFGVQKNWFNALFSQLNVVHKTGMVPHMAGRQKEVFTAVEREFEGLWERHVKGKGLQGNAHRGMLLCCLAVATHKVLRYESGDDELVREVVRTNLGGLAVGVMMKLHTARLWVLLKLLAEDPFKQAVAFLPNLQGDLGVLVSSEVEVGKDDATWRTSSCKFYEVLAAEDCLELMPEFCCQYGMQWLEGFGQYGVRVGLEKSFVFEDGCCQVRISRPLGARPQQQQGQQIPNEQKP